MAQVTASKSFSNTDPVNRFHGLTLPDQTVKAWGTVNRAIGTSIRVQGLAAHIGQRCEIVAAQERNVYADVVGIEQGELILYPLGGLEGIGIGSKVRIMDDAHRICYGDSMLGAVYDGFGKPLGDSPFINNGNYRDVSADSPSPLTRTPVQAVFTTGVRAIDALLTTGVGQRLGIFAAAGGGKSTLLAMIARACVADVVVIALVGERGREVGEFLALLDETGMRHRVVLVVATSDRPAMERAVAAKTATAIAEGFRDEGKSVLLLVDSVTRYARALREIGLSAGEPPVRRGFPPSVFSELPKLFERTGNNETGSITAFYTVLIEGEDDTDPIAEECRSILDGHIVLSRALGEAGHYPAIDILQSTSRLFTSLAEPEDQRAATHLRRLMAKYQDLELLLQMGEYQSGTDQIADEAISKQSDIRMFLVQPYQQSAELEDTRNQLKQLMS